MHPVKPPEDSLGTPASASVGGTASQRSYAFRLLSVFFVFKVLSDNCRGQQKNRNRLIQYHHLNKKQGIKMAFVVSQTHKILKYLQRHSNKLRPKQNENYAILNHVILFIINLEFPNSCAPASRLDQGCVSIRPTFTTSFFLYKTQ